MLKNPNTGRDDRRISVAIYEPVRDAILGAIDDAGTLLYSELNEQVEARTNPDMWADSSVAWYTISVKLHLEAIGLISRSGSPQQLELTDLGRTDVAKGG